MSSTSSAPLPCLTAPTIVPERVVTVTLSPPRIPLLLDSDEIDSTGKRASHRCTLALRTIDGGLDLQRYRSFLAGLVDLVHVLVCAHDASEGLPIAESQIPTDAGRALVAAE